MCQNAKWALVHMDLFFQIVRIHYLLCVSWLIIEHVCLAPSLSQDKLVQWLTCKAGMLQRWRIHRCIGKGIEFFKLSRQFSVNIQAQLGKISTNNFLILDSIIFAGQPWRYWMFIADALLNCAKCTLYEERVQRFNFRCFSFFRQVRPKCEQ